MNRHWKRSRVTKALTDAGLAASFGEAEARLDAVRVCVRVSREQCSTPAGQAATLTAVATAFKCFGRVCVDLDAPNADLRFKMPLGSTLHDATKRLGATPAEAEGSGITHTILIGSAAHEGVAWSVYCWWDRWLAGTRVDPDSQVGESGVSLSGVFSAGLAVRQIFADVRRGSASRSADVTVSLWTPSAPADLNDVGPSQVSIPNDLWIVGLGHLGQAAVWALLTLPCAGPRHAVLQDDDRIGEENEATSLLVRGDVFGLKKARVAASWLEGGGWTTDLIERRHEGDIRVTTGDPPILLAGLDALPGRKALAGASFDYMIDVGIGDDAASFEGIQIRVVPKGAPVEGLWGSGSTVDARERLSDNEAYRAAEKDIGTCGKVMLADASVAVPFVGAAAAALAVTQAIRLASLKSGVVLLQVELASPSLVIDGGEASASECYLGSDVVSVLEDDEDPETGLGEGAELTAPFRPRSSLRDGPADGPDTY